MNFKVIYQHEVPRMTGVLYTVPKHFHLKAVINVSEIEEAGVTGRKSGPIVSG